MRERKKEKEGKKKWKEGTRKKEGSEPKRDLLARYSNTKLLKV